MILVIEHRDTFLPPPAPAADTRPRSTEQALRRMAWPFATEAPTPLPARPRAPCPRRPPRRPARG